MVAVPGERSDVPDSYGSDPHFDDWRNLAKTACPDVSEGAVPSEVILFCGIDLWPGIRSESWYFQRMDYKRICVRGEKTETLNREVLSAKVSAVPKPSARGV